MQHISEEQFTRILQAHSNDQWERALTVFRDYGQNLAFDVINVLVHACEQKKVAEVLGILEEHYASYLHYQHPDVRGRVHEVLLGANPTHAMFARIYAETLALQPNPK